VVPGVIGMPPRGILLGPQPGTQGWGEGTRTLYYLRMMDGERLWSPLGNAFARFHPASEYFHKVALEFVQTGGVGVRLELVAMERKEDWNICDVIRDWRTLHECPRVLLWMEIGAADEVLDENSALYQEVRNA
jgi:hypothetical protein